MRINPNSEHTIQANFFDWVELHKRAYPELDLFYAIPNSAKRGQYNGWLMKLTGTRRGVPDVHLPLPSRSGTFIGLWLEFKSEKGVVSPEQKQWIEKLRASGHCVEVVRSWHYAANITIEHLGLPLVKF